MSVTDLVLTPPPSLSTDRRGFLGGSDIGALLGLSPWKTPYELWEEKTAPEPPEAVIEPEREKRLRRGKRLEPWVMEMLEEERGISIFRRNQYYTDPEHDWMKAEIDFEYMSDLGLCNGDVKTISPFAASEWGEQETDEIPLYYCLQFHWGMMVTGRPLTLVAALIGADDLRVYEVKRDDELIAEIRRRAIEFWIGNVQLKVPPAPQTQRDAEKLLAKYGGMTVAGNEEVWRTTSRLKGVKAALKRLEEVKGKYELEIKQFLVVQAEALGAKENEKWIINGPDGKKLVSLAKQNRAGYTVQPTSFYVLRTS